MTGAIFSIDDRIYGTVLQSEKHFVAAQKAALDVILKSLSPNLPEVLNF